MESQPQNPEFRNNPENFRPCTSQLTCRSPVNDGSLHYLHSSFFYQINLYIFSNSVDPDQLLFKNKYFVCFVALLPKSTAMVMAGRSVHLTTLFHGQA